MTPCQLIRHTAARFRSAGIPDPENDSALLLASLCGGEPLSLRLDTDTILEEPLLSRYELLTRQRLERIPLQYILGEAPFCGHLFMVDPRVLIPRPETELLCAWALDILKNYRDPRVLDLCCGSGCIGLSLKAASPEIRVTLSDISANALTVAAENVRRLSLKAELHQGDLLDGLLPGSFDLIVCNPPYIPTADCAALQEEVLFEPRNALDGGADGLDLYRRLIASAAGVLVPGGALMMELGIHQADSVSALLAASGYMGIQVRKDLNGIERMILAYQSGGGKYDR